MSSKHSILKKATAIFGVRIATVLSSLIVLIYFSHHFSTALFGSFQTFWIHTSVLSVVAGLGLSALFYTYNPSKLVFLFSNIAFKSRIGYLVFLACVSILFVLLQFYFNDVFPKTLFSFVALFCYFVILTLSVLLEALTVIFGNYLFLLIASIGSAITTLCCYLLFAQIGISSELLVVLLSLCLLLKVGMYFFALKKSFVVTAAEVFDISNVKQLWVHLGFYEVSQTVFRFLDKFILTFFLTKELLSVYTNSTYEIPVFAIVYATIRSTSSIYFAQHHVSLQKDAAYMKKIGELMGIFTFASVAFLIAFDGAYMTVVFSEKYLVGIPIFLIAILKIPAMNFAFTAYLQFHEKGAIINKGAIIDIILSLALVYPLYLLFGLKGISLAIVLSTYFQVFYYAYYAKQIMQATWKEVLPLRHWAIQIVVFSACAYLASAICSYKALGAIGSLAVGFGVMGMIAMFWVVLVYNKSKTLLNNT